MSITFWTNQIPSCMPTWAIIKQQQNGRFEIEIIQNADFESLRSEWHFANHISVLIKLGFNVIQVTLDERKAFSKPSPLNVTHFWVADLPLVMPSWAWIAGINDTAYKIAVDLSSPELLIAISEEMQPINPILSLEKDFFKKYGFKIIEEE